MTLLVDGYGRPLTSSTEPDIISPAGVPVRSARPAPAGPHDRTIELPHELPARLKWRALVAEALSSGWDPNVPEPPEDILCADIPLRQILEVLVERDVLVGLVRGRDGFAEDGCVKCGAKCELCTCDAGTCWVCGCTEEEACEGGCGWADPQQRVCTTCTHEIAVEDLQELQRLLAAKKGRRR